MAASRVFLWKAKCSHTFDITEGLGCQHLVGHVRSGLSLSVASGSHRGRDACRRWRPARRLPHPRDTPGRPPPRLAQRIVPVPGPFPAPGEERVLKAQRLGEPRTVPPPGHAPRGAAHWAFSAPRGAAHWAFSAPCGAVHWAFSLLSVPTRAPPWTPQASVTATYSRKPVPTPSLVVGPPQQ